MDRVERQVLDMREASIYLGIDYDTLRAYVKADLITPVRYPSLVRKGQPRRKKQFRIAELDRFMTESEKQPESCTKSCTKKAVQTARSYPKGWHEKFALVRPTKR